MLVNGQERPEKCEVCQAPARVWVQDVRETEPDVDPKTGDRYAHWEMDGPLHAFCAAHRRAHRQTPRTVETGK